MVNGEQGEGGGQRTYSEEDVMSLMNEAARRAASEAMKSANAQNAAQNAQNAQNAAQNAHAQNEQNIRNAQKAREEEDDAEVSVINPKVVRQLKDTVAVFTALKDLSSNPLQKTIEETVGGMAASVVQSAFAPRGPPPKQDIVDKVLNSQFAFGLGSGLGQRAPELVETMGRTFGTDKAGQMMDSIIGKYGTGGGQGGSRQLSQGPSSGSSSPPSPPPSSSTEQKTDKQTEKELLLSLDPNNPEHVSAYAETQGGLPVDVARKMLMIHQDAFIEQLKRDGMNIDQISTQRGSRAQPNPPVQQPSPIQKEQQAHTAQPIPPSPTYPSYQDSHVESPSQSPDDIEYAEYRDDVQQGHGLDQQSGQPIPPNVDGQQVDMMKTFATDIGKVMGEMLNKIESLNNTVFTLQSEMNDMKMQGPKQSSSIHTEMSPRISSYPPGMADAHDTFSDISPPIIRQSTHVEAPSLETFEDQGIESPKEEPDIKRSEDFFEEDVIDVSDFKQGLEEDAKLSVQEKQRQTSPPADQPIKVAQPVPPVAAQPVPPMVVQPTLPIQKSEIPLVVKQPMIRPAKEKDDDKSNIDIPKKEYEELETSGEKNETSGEKNDDNFVTPIKKAGIHKKAAYGNIKPSFKKSDGKENKEGNNI